MNGDGKTDLVVANQYESTISVLLGDGAGSFGAKTDFAVGNFPSSVALADLNGDGKLDVVAALPGADAVGVLLGDGAGGLGVETRFGIGTSPLFATIGDVNGDGKPDIAATNYSANTVSVLPGDGTGSFGSRADFATGMLPRDVVIRDVSGDGKADLVVASSGSNALTVFYGDGTGAFNGRNDYAVGLTPLALKVLDLNGDGRPDLVVTDFDGDNVTVLLDAPLTSYTFTNVTADHTIHVSIPADLPPVVHVTSPNGAENFEVGSTHDLNWLATDDLAVQSVSLFVSRDLGASWQSVATDIANTGTFAWVVATPSTNTTTAPVYSALFKAVAKDGAGVTGEDVSDAAFSIFDPTVSTSQDLPHEFAFSIRGANPSRGASHFDFAVPRTARVRLSVLDLQGREISVLADGSYAAGRYPLGWDGRTEGGPAAAGMYFVRFRTPDKKFLQRLVLVR